MYRIGMFLTKKKYTFIKKLPDVKKIRPKIAAWIFFRLDHFRTQQSRTFFWGKINVDDRIYVTHSTTPTTIKYMERVSCNNKVRTEREYSMDGNPVSIFLIHFFGISFHRIFHTETFYFWFATKILDRHIKSFHPIWFLSNKYFCTLYKFLRAQNLISTFWRLLKPRIMLFKRVGFCIDI